MDVLCSELYIFIHILSTSLHNNSSHTQNIQNIVQTLPHFTTVLCSTSQPFVYDYTFSVDEHSSFVEKHLIPYSNIQKAGHFRSRRYVMVLI